MVFNFSRGGQLYLAKETGVLGENHRPIHDMTVLSHKVVSSTPQHTITMTTAPKICWANIIHLELCLYNFQ